MNRDVQSRIERLREAMRQDSIGYHEQCQILGEMWKFGDYIEDDTNRNGAGNFTHFSNWLARNGIDLSPGEISDRVKVAQYLVDPGFGDFVRRGSRTKSGAIARHLHRSLNYRDPAGEMTQHNKEDIAKNLSVIEKNRVPIEEIGKQLRDNGFPLTASALRQKRKGEDGWFEVRSHRLPGLGEIYLEVIYDKLVQLDTDLYRDVDAVTFQMAVAYAKTHLNWTDVEKEVVERATEGLSIAA